MRTCPTGHPNPDRYSYCGSCGMLLPVPSHPLMPTPPSGLVAAPQAGPRRSSSSTYVRIGVLTACAAFLVALLAIGISKRGHSPSQGNAQSGDARLTSTLQDWEGSVCQGPPRNTGGSVLRNSTTEQSCLSPVGNPIIMGAYPSTSAMRQDAAGIPYDAPYATITDPSTGEAWLFVAFEDSAPGRNTQRVLDPNYVPSAPTALAPLVGFGFKIVNGSR